MTTRADRIEAAARRVLDNHPGAGKSGECDCPACDLAVAIALPPDEPVRLPVIATCGQCAVATDDAPSRPGYPACLHHAIGERSLASLVEPPPDWCPLRKATP